MLVISLGIAARKLLYSKANALGVFYAYKSENKNIKIFEVDVEGCNIILIGFAEMIVWYNF